VRVGWPRQRVPRWGGHSGSIQSGFVVSLPGGADHQTRPAARCRGDRGGPRALLADRAPGRLPQTRCRVCVGRGTESGLAEGPSGPSAEKTVLIAEIDGVVVGFISSGPVRGAIDDAARTGEVYELFVDPASFGRGVGTALMERTLDRASRSSNAVPSVSGALTYQVSGGRCSQVRDPNHHFPGKAHTPLGIERLGPVG
jgi:GNAT superfamily N-acetyltransferase